MPMPMYYFTQLGGPALSVNSSININVSTFTHDKYCGIEFVVPYDLMGVVLKRSA